MQPRVTTQLPTSCTGDVGRARRALESPLLLRKVSVSRADGRLGGIIARCGFSAVPQLRSHRFISTSVHPSGARSPSFRYDGSWPRLSHGTYAFSRRSKTFLGARGSAADVKCTEANVDAGSARFLRICDAVHLTLFPLCRFLPRAPHWAASSRAADFR